MQTTIQNKNISATINHFGAELFSLKKDDRNFIWEIDEKYWNKTSPVLFPIVGSLKNGTYFYQGKSYELSRHGFARNFEFELKEKSENSATFSLKYSEQTLKVYPFEFELQIIYTISDSQLEIKYVIANNSSSEMPFSIGAHPAFAIDGDFEDYTLIFDTNESLISHRIENDLLSGETQEIILANNQLPLNYKLFEKDAIVLKNKATSSLALLKNNIPQLKVNFPDFPYLGIWTKQNAPFICIEPWLGIADNVTAKGNILEKEGIQLLKSNKDFEIAFNIELF